MTQTQMQTDLKLVDAVSEAVQAAGPQGIPSGRLYSMLMEMGCSLNQYNGLIGIAVKMGKITNSNHLLRSCV